MAHVIHSPQSVDPLFLLPVQQVMIAWLDTVNYCYLHLLHVSSMLLEKMLAQTPHTRLAVLSVAIVAAHKPSLVK